jgi:acyl-coenzyme A thioesterase PaaI-like protein
MTAEPTPLPHPFDAAIALDPLGGGRSRGLPHPAWANMVGPFGGITAATLLNAVLGHPERVGEPVALTVNYAAALSASPFEIVANPVRTGRSVQHWGVELRQDGAVAATATAVLATRRDTWSAEELAPPAVPPAQSVAVTPRYSAVEWPNRYEMRFHDGPWPDLTLDAELPDSLSTLWVRDDPPRPLDVLSLAAICDVFYPRTFRRRQRFVAAGTVTLTVHFHADRAAFATQGVRPVLAVARGLRYHQGFYDQRAEVWSDAGRLLASSMQSVWYRE